MRPKGFQIDQSNRVFSGVTQQVKLALAAKLVHPELAQIAFLALTHIGVFGHSLHRRIGVGNQADLGQFFVNVLPPTEN